MIPLKELLGYDQNLEYLSRVKMIPTLSDISVNFIKLTFRSRFFLAKICRKIPTLAKLVDKLLFEGDDIQVIPRNASVKSKNLKVKDIEINADIPISEDTVLPNEVIKEMIRRSTHHFIMDFCICRVSTGCKDYPQDLGCLFLGKGATNISSKLGRSVSSEDAIEHVNRCHEAGLVHIIGRNKIDSIWLNTGPKDELLSICHCCPCCCLWKMIPELPEDIGNGFLPMIGVELNFNQELCTGCGMCALDSCFVNAIKMMEGKAEIDLDKCRKCGRCAELCENDALTISLTSDAVNSSIERVEKLVDVRNRIEI